MEVILSRHGNTFNPHDPVVWTGSKNDLSLVKKGEQQALALVQYLRDENIVPSAVYCGPLQRTKRYAEIVVSELCLDKEPRVDQRLNEVDYGDWTGLTTRQVIARHGKEVFEGWDQKSVWPPLNGGGWGGSPEALRLEVRSFMDELMRTHRANDVILVISSNGRLRYFLSLIKNEPDSETEFDRRIKAGTFKVKTGNICKMMIQNGDISLESWNQNPSVKD
jgi:broad specificity phosphatase PhoE